MPSIASGFLNKILKGTEFKSCPKCEEVKDINDFYKRKNGKYYSWCKNCTNYKKDKRSNFLNEKYCKKCLKFKSLKDYSVAQIYKGNRILKSYCKPCCSEISREWYKNNRERHNKWQREHRKKKMAS